jgi:hypothetical protein
LGDTGNEAAERVEAKNAASRERAFANLVVPPVYLRKVYALIEWVAANPKPLGNKTGSI